MTILELIKNKLEGKTILVRNKWKLNIKEVKIDYDDVDSPETIQLKCESPTHKWQFFTLCLEDDFEIITKE
jgi:hypothetical protein